MEKGSLQKSLENLEVLETPEIFWRVSRAWRKKQGDSDHVLESTSENAEIAEIVETFSVTR